MMRFVASVALVGLVGMARAQSTAVPTLRANAKIVVIDVVVTDSHGQPVTGLKPSDFLLKEDGVAQQIDHFEAFTAAKAGKLQEIPKLEPNVFTNFTPVPDGALNVLLVDALNTPPGDQMYMRSEILKYLKSAKPGTRMAIFGLKSDLKLLQGFTSDPAVLIAVLESRRNTTAVSPLPTSTSANPVSPPDFFSSIAESFGNDPSLVQTEANMRDFDATLQASAEQLRIQMTLDALDDLGRYLGGLPGRKNLLWFSGSFPLSILPSPSRTNRFDSAIDFSDQFHHVVSQLMRSQVAVYPIDGRGLMSGATAIVPSTPNVPMPSAAVMSGEKKFFADSSADHATMQEMANETGGMAFINTNGLTAAVKQAVEAGANYYSLSYTPTNRGFHGDFRKLQVQLANAGLKLSYRHGYYADDLEAPATRPTAAPVEGTSALDPRGSPMRAAMQFGGPDPTEILFKAAIEPVAGEPAVEVGRGSRLEPPFSGPFKRFVVTVAVLPTDVKIDTLPTGKHRLDVTLVTRVYSANGEVETSATTQASGDIDDARYAALMRGGLQFRQEISVPVAGQSYLRVGVHDVKTDRVGAVEIPVSVLDKLQPVTKPVAIPK